MVQSGRWKYDPVTNEVVTSEEFHSRQAERNAAKRRSTLGAPAVIGAMPPIKSMADGLVYDDKRSYERSVHRAGCEIIGHDPNWTDHIKAPYDAKAHEADVVGDIKKSIEQVSSHGGALPPEAFN